jgi:hypothetical protein
MRWFMQSTWLVKTGHMNSWQYSAYRGHVDVLKLTHGCLPHHFNYLCLQVLLASSCCRNYQRQPCACAAASQAWAAGCDLRQVLQQQAERCFKGSLGELVLQGGKP